MGYRDYKTSSGSTLWNTSNPLVMLIILNAMVFILLNFLKSIYTFSSLSEALFYQDIYRLFAMPADPSTFLSRPWTLLTMQFSEVKLFVAISNLFWLWTFAYLIQDLIGGDKLIPLYLYCGTVSAFVFFITANLFYGNQVPEVYFTAVSSAILGLAVAAAVIAPQYRFFPMIGGGIPLWIISLIYLLVDVSSMARNPVMLIPHAASGLMGLCFIRLLNNGVDLGAWMN
jgi:membrane associated rhomboid family serine protease